MSSKDEFNKLPPDGRLGEAPVSPEYHEMLKGIITAVDEAFNGKTRPKKVGFIILQFEYGNVGGRANYMSNGADRRDVLAMLKEQVRRFEQDLGIVATPPDTTVEVDRS